MSQSRTVSASHSRSRSPTPPPSATLDSPESTPDKGKGKERQRDGTMTPLPPVRSTMGALTDSRLGQASPRRVLQPGTERPRDQQDATSEPQPPRSVLDNPRALFRPDPGMRSCFEELSIESGVRSELVKLWGV